MKKSKIDKLISILINKGVISIDDFIEKEIITQYPRIETTEVKKYANSPNKGDN